MWPVAPQVGHKTRGLYLRRAINCVSTIVFSNDNESVDSLLRRFNRKVMQDGVLSEARRRARFQKPLTRRTRKQVAARRAATKASRNSARTSK